MRVNVDQRVKEHWDLLDHRKYNVLGVFLQGSQNYELDYKDSDVDTKAIIIPKFQSFVKSEKQISTTLVLDNDEHIDLKDIRLMLQNFKKQNINFVEILFTKYKYYESMNPYYQMLIDNREEIARYDTKRAVSSMCGMAHEKYKALEHPYPATLDKIKKYGYDPKQLHHILRLQDFISDYTYGKPYKECLVPSWDYRKNYLIEVKQGKHTLEEAREIASKSLQSIVDMKDKYVQNNDCKIDKNIDALFDFVLYNIFKNSFKEEINT